mmetsp:Transcript_29749/g.74815  ORF Transcript_29749/g.74815 Transcript_29749/m.74815 type:complete len:560 (-) Transcript_29749:36-1715(-)
MRWSLALAWSAVLLLCLLSQPAAKAEISLRGGSAEGGEPQQEGGMMTCEEAEDAADELKASGSFQEAADMWVSIIGACGDSAVRRSALGVCLLRDGQIEEAELAFVKALEMDPTRASDAANMASLTFSTGELQKADAWAQKCVAAAKSSGKDGILRACETILRKATDAIRIQSEQEKLLAHHEARGDDGKGGGSGDEGVCTGSSGCNWQEGLRRVRDGEAEFSSIGPKHGNIVKVDEYEASELTFEHFWSNYAMRSKPVVIRNMKSRVSGSLSLEKIKALCGNETVHPRVYSEEVEGTGGIKLANADPLTLDEYLTERENGRADGRLVFDWPLPMNCPEILKDFAVPSYFAQDFLQNISSRAEKADPDDPTAFILNGAWPSLFVGPEMSGGGLHIDALGTNFWMVVLEGEKLWQFFEPEQLPYLYPDPKSDTMLAADRLQVDTVRPDYEAFPLYAFASSFMTVVGPNDGLFVPAGSPHQVTNLSPSVAVSMNYIDSSNLDRAISVLEHSSKDLELATKEHLRGFRDSVTSSVSKDFADRNVYDFVPDRKDASWASFKAT